MGMCMDGFMFGSCCRRKDAQDKEGLALDHEPSSNNPQSLTNSNDPQKFPSLGSSSTNGNNINNNKNKPLVLTPELSATSTVVNTFHLTHSSSSDTGGSSHVIISKVPSETTAFTTSNNRPSLTTTSSTTTITTKRPYVVPGVYIVKPGNNLDINNKPIEFPTEHLHSATAPKPEMPTTTEEVEETTEPYWVGPSRPIVIKPPVAPSRPTRPPKPIK